MHSPLVQFNGVIFVVRAVFGRTTGVTEMRLAVDVNEDDEQCRLRRHHP